MIVKVKNLHSGDRDAPYPYNSWIEYWKDNSNCSLPSKCPASGEITTEFDGGHVKKVGNNDNKWYITPLSKTFNRSRIEKEFSVDEKYLIPVNP